MIKKQDTHKRDLCVKRAKELLEDKWAVNLLCLIGEENNLTPEEVEEKRNTEEFFEMIVSYLMIDDEKLS